ncbi:ribonuclease H-like domain-containing protein [Tanacetum coccineum]
MKEQAYNKEQRERPRPHELNDKSNLIDLMKECDGGRKLIDEFTLSEVSSSTCWIKAVPIKVNDLAWKIKLDNLPTRLNISRRAMDIDSILCPTCGKAVESTRHIFFTCQIAKDILHLITRWWNIPYMEVSSYEEWAKETYKMIDCDIREQMDSESFDIFTETAYDCVNEERSQCPNIDEIVMRLEKALEKEHTSFKAQSRIVDSGDVLMHKTRNKSYLLNIKTLMVRPSLLLDESKGCITGKICDKKNKVLFTDSKCLVLSPEFKLPDENQVLLRIPRQNNMYSFNLENIVPSEGNLVKVYLQRFFKMTTLSGCLSKRKATQGLLFSWVFFLRTKDETSRILKDFIRQIENQLNQKVKTIRCDNGTEFKNRDFIEFCGSKGIKREYSNARTPQQNGVAERKNRTLIEAARTMLADSFLPNTFWAEAVSTACYVLNRVLVTKPQNKTPYELVTGKIPIISYIRPFGCHVTILNTIDHLGKFDGKSDEGFLVGYSLQSKAFRVYNLETKRVEESLHITFLENKPNVAGKGPTWLFDLDYLTDSINYQPVSLENQANKHAGQQEAIHNVGTEDIFVVGDSEKEAKSAQNYFVLPIWSFYTSTVKKSAAKNAGKAPTKHPNLKSDEKPVDKEYQVFLDELERLKRQEQDANDAAKALRKEFAKDTEDLLLQVGAAKASGANTVNTASTPVSTASAYGGPSFSDLTNADQDDFKIPALEEIYNNPTDGIFTHASYDDEGAVADFTNLETVVNVIPISTSRINSIHPSTLILGDPKLAVQTRSKVTQSSGAHAFEELLQFKIQKVWILIDFPYGKKAIGTK